MVGRELLITCPDGEDHRRHDQGDTIEEEEEPFGGRIHGWRKSKVMKRRIIMWRITTDGSPCAMAVDICDK